MDDFQYAGEPVQSAPQAQKARAEDRLVRAQCVHPVRTAGGSVLVRRIQIAQQGAQGVGEDFCAEVLLQCQVIQACDRFQTQSVLDSFERFFDPPALVIERAERRSRIALAIEQRGHQHTHTTARRDIADRAHGRRRTRQFVPVCPVPPVSPLARLAAAGKGGDAAPVTCIDAHAELNAALGDRRDHRVADKAAIEQQQIGMRLQHIEGFE